MSEGYQFQVNVWQPSPDAKPVVERHVVHGRVVELGPNWVAEQLPRIADPDTRDHLDKESLAKKVTRNFCQVASGWMHHGIAATNRGCMPTTEDSLCLAVGEWLGIPRDAQAFDGKHRPACMVGAIAAYVASHPEREAVVRGWCSQYRLRLVTKKPSATDPWTVPLYQCIAQKGSTKGIAKKLIYVNAIRIIDAYWRGDPAVVLAYDTESIDDPILRPIQGLQ